MIFWSGIYQRKKLEDFQKVFSTFHEPVTETFAPWKLLEKPEIKEMEKEKRMKVPCKLNFLAEDSFINILKQ